MDNKVIYVASKFGDSQLIKLHYEFNENGSHITLLDQYLNLGPIVDMCLVDIDQRGQEQIVTCSGMFSRYCLFKKLKRRIYLEIISLFFINNLKGHIKMDLLEL